MPRKKHPATTRKLRALEFAKEQAERRLAQTTDPKEREAIRGEIEDLTWQIRTLRK